MKSQSKRARAINLSPCPCIRKTIGELEQSITQSEFNEWMYFLSTEPLASDRNEMQMSILLNMLASLWV